MNVVTKSKSNRSSKLTRLFDALGDATRFTLFQKLHDNQDYCVSDLAEELDITPAGASQQLKTLEQSGVLVRVRKGQRICYQVNTEDPDVKHVIELLDK